MVQEGQQPSCRLFLYNNSLFVAQVVFGLFTLSFSAAMLSLKQSPAVYLPVMTAVLGWFFPSPLNGRFEAPGKSIKDLLNRNINNV
jgi:hypothetical protein